MTLPTSYSWTLSNQGGSGIGTEGLGLFPHDFEFIEDNRRGMVFSGSIRLDPKRNLVLLKADPDTGLYPTTGDHYVISPLFDPQAVRQWVGFQASIQHYSNGLSQDTGDGFRLHDGTNQWWWDGAVWAQSTSNWNTEAEIADNLATFDASERALRVVVRLTTADPRKTPLLSWVRIAWSGKVFVMEDLVFRTIVPMFKQTRIIIDFAIKIAFPGGTSLGVKAAVDATTFPLNVVGVDAVFNHTSDPEHMMNLMSSYNPTTGIATLASAIPVGQFAVCRLICQPQVAVELTSQDYVEVEKAPALIIQSIESVDSSELAQDVGIANKSAETIIRIPAPYRFDLRFTMVALTPGAVDLQRTIDSIVELMSNNPLIKSKALGEQYRIYMIDEFNTNTRPNDANLHQMQASFKICEVLAFKRQATVETPVIAPTLNFEI